MQDAIDSRHRNQDQQNRTKPQDQSRADTEIPQAEHISIFKV